MSEVHILAIDLAKRSFQVCATAPGGAVLFNRTVSRAKREKLLGEHDPCIVAMEACATSHFWSRFATGCGHEVRLIPPIYVKPFVKRQKNDAADAVAIAEAALRPNMHYVAVKSAEHQARAVTFRTHQCFVRQRAQLINALRGHLAEFGLAVAQGPANLKSVVGMMADENIDLPDAVQDIVAIYLDQIELLTQKIDGLTFRLREAMKVNDEMRRLCSVPGVGPITASAIMAFAPDLHSFSTGRNFAA
jgi:transposase